jgi:tRNA G26 N,N-dimethylase Trm1
VLRRERGDVDDEHQHVLLWASMLKDQTTSEKVREQARERHLNTREELLKRQRAFHQYAQRYVVEDTI